MHRFRILVAYVLCISVWASCAPAQTNSPDTKRILDLIVKTASKRTPDDLAAANDLNRKGDQAYKRHRYDTAFTAYENSYPNAPNAYAYIMAGDTHWREVLRTHEAIKAHGAPRCSLDNSHFAHDLSTDISQHQAVGLALASQNNNASAPNPTFYQRARESTACLQAMAQHYQAEPSSACVDVEQLRKCLGAPLIK